MDHERIPPHDLHVERALLSALLHPDDWQASHEAAKAAGLRPEDFYRGQHQDLYRRLLSLAWQGPPDVSLLARWLDPLPGWDGCAYDWILENCTVPFASSANVPRQCLTLRELALRRQAIRLGTTLVQGSYALNGSDEGAAGQLLADAIEELQHARETGTGARTLQTLDGTALSSIELPPEDTLVDGVWTRGEWILLLGEDKAGKSMLALDLACALAEDPPSDAATTPTWLDLPVHAGRRVLYLVGEGGLRLFARRHKTRTAHLSPEAHARLHYWFPRRGVLLDLLDPQDCEAIRHYIIEHAIDALIIDPLVVFSSADENEADAIKPLAQNILRLKEDTGAGILLVHHTRKASITSRRGSLREARGSSVLTGLCDGGISFEHDTDDSADPRRRVTFTLRYQESPPPLVVALDTETLRFRVEVADPGGRPNDPASSPDAILQFLRERGPSRSKDIGDALNARPRTLQRRLTELGKAGKLVVTKRAVGVDQRWGLPEQIDPRDAVDLPDAPRDGEGP